jgi:hypothetical protein
MILEVQAHECNCQSEVQYGGQIVPSQWETSEMMFLRDMFVYICWKSDVYSYVGEPTDILLLECKEFYTVPAK